MRFGRSLKERQNVTISKPQCFCYESVGTGDDSGEVPPPCAENEKMDL